MIQPDKFIYTLITRGGVKKYVLPVAPKGWDKQVIKYIRNDTYFGLVRSLTAPLEFVLQGAKIIRREWYKYRIKADIKLTIQQINDDWSYTTVYSGTLDFSTIKENDKSVTITVVDSNMLQKIKAYSGADYEVPISGDNVKNIPIPPLKLLESASFIFNQLLQGRADFFPQLQVVNVEAAANQSSTQDVEFYNQTDPDFSTDGHWFYRANINTKFTLKGDLQIFITNGNNSVLDISLYDETGAKLYTPFHSSTITGLVYLDLDFTVNLTAGRKLFWYFDSDHDGVGAGFVITEGKFNIQYFTQSAATNCDMIPLWYLYEQLMKNMAGSDVLTQSKLLKQDWKRLYVSCGDSLRQLNTKQSTDAAGNIVVTSATPAIKTNFDDFFQSINAVLGAGFGAYGDVATLEKKDYFFVRTVKSATIEQTKNVEFSQVAQYLYNTLKAGYAPQTYDQINGRDEFNSEVNWILPIDVTDGESKQLDLQCRYRADMYGIELTRINLADKKTIDSDSDNDIFLFVLNEELTAIQTAPPAYSGSIAAETMYNWEISPKRNLLRQGSWLHSILFGLDAYTIKYGSADKNTDLQTTDFNGVTVAEGTDIKVSSLASALFMPIQADFECDFNRLLYLDENPNGYLEFPRGTKVYRGFMTAAGVDISKNSAQDYTLILTADNIL